MDRAQPSKKGPRMLRRTPNKGFWAQSATQEARNTLDNFENFVRGRSRQQIVGACVAIALTIFIFLAALYVGNFLVALIVVAVWLTT